MKLTDIFEAIPSPSPGSSDKLLYAVMLIPGNNSYFVGKDSDSLACLLISTIDHGGRPLPAIRLESLDAQFELRCRLQSAGEPEREGIFTVIRCRISDRETIRYFLSICETIVRIFGDNPTRAQVTTAVNQLAAIFQRIREAPTRSVNGLFGELYLILHSGSAIRAMTAWRVDENARFDFADGDIRLDVKASGGRSRVHTFSYEQCNPPPGTIALVASLYAEQVAGGASLVSVIGQIESRIAGNPDLVFKLRQTVAATLGTGLSDGLSRCFDLHLAESSLQFFDITEIPAIRGPVPTGVSDVHFRSDLSALLPLSSEALIDQDPMFWDFLPREDNSGGS